MSPFYWKRHPDGPFVTFIAVATTYLHPESDDLDSLKALARREGDEEKRVVKSELREALRDPSQLPRDELFKSVQYDNGSSEAFLRWLWHELYGDEPFDADSGSRRCRNLSPSGCTGRPASTSSMLPARAIGPRPWTCCSPR
jgi:hypothetical protein